ncbi:5'/3'-nucleotidase SurE [Nocardioides sp. GY 10113]|uniref:5'/3'-nucleotidase SurE n=1 Tax=Nocardioides sp. GY 10113 TaxID=2569761 RepID=UPI0010A92C22|nr:5'/3'-nucleotidase SurE [Nocardioides sp. GY 10113]TIC88964.1 5'/3'-nucleotidase SurE [Nocardioides sp. GY 10113]
MKPSRLLLPTACAALAVTGLTLTTASGTPAPPAAAASEAPATLPTEGLDILLTNDDGWNAPGISAVFDALTAAGHHVTMVAPAANQSGVSAQVQFYGAVTVTERGPDRWSVTTTPAGTVHFAMDQLFAGERPDLVVSGTNVGQNTGFDTNYSGTVAAATVASGAYGVPAVAISTATSYGREAEAAYGETADLLVEMIAAGLPELPRGEYLNVNYPVLSEARPAPLGLVYAENSQESLARIGFAQDPTDPSRYAIAPGLNPVQHAEGTDTKELADGYVTVTVLEADRSVDAAKAPAVLQLLHGMEKRLAKAAR